MIERIKEQLWKILRDKQVSLAMIYAGDGEILWRHGREIEGRNVNESTGFCRGAALRVIERRKEVAEENCQVNLSPTPLADPACRLNVKSLLIIPMAGEYFLYLDSGASRGFGEREVGAFETLAVILNEILKSQIEKKNGRSGDRPLSPFMRELNEKLVRYAIEEEPVLLVGRTGVGKNRVGEMIHRFSGRKGSYVVAHCPTIPESLFESEIFGHKKGAFTGADRDKTGLLAQAELGTLFIDEISEVPLSFQSKLLRFIESKSYNVLGESREQRTNVRIIAASNHDLPAEIRQGRFRDDLYFRLNALSIDIPPLKERKEEIPFLVQEYRDCLRGKEIGPQAMQALLDYDWPGNIRELITVLKRVGIDHPQGTIGAEIAGIIDATGYSARGAREASGRPVAAAGVWQEFELGRSFWEVVWKPFILSRKFNRQEVREIILEAYRRADGNLLETMGILGIGRDDYKKFVAYLHKYHIHPAR